MVGRSVPRQRYEPQRVNFREEVGEGEERIFQNFTIYTYHPEIRARASTFLSCIVVAFSCKQVSTSSMFHLTFCHKTLILLSPMSLSNNFPLSRSFKLSNVIVLYLLLGRGCSGGIDTYEVRTTGWP